MCLLHGIRQRTRGLRYLIDGDGGDENLKSYPLEDSDLTLSSVLRNPLLYQEGWGVDAIKHSLAYSGGLSRSYVRTYAPAAALGFDAFSPFTVRSVIAAAVSIPFEQVLDGTCRAAADAQARRCVCWSQGGHRHRDASQSEAAFSGRGACRTSRTGQQSLVPPDVQPNLAGAAARSRGTRTAIGEREFQCRTAVIQNAKCKMQRENAIALKCLHFEF